MIPLGWRISCASAAESSPMAASLSLRKRWICSSRASRRRAGIALNALGKSPASSVAAVEPAEHDGLDTPRGIHDRHVQPAKLGVLRLHAVIGLLVFFEALARRPCRV